MKQKFISKAEFLDKKERANRSLELANFEHNLSKLIPQKNRRTMLNHNSPNVRVARGYCLNVK
jgi:hypothetical protein